MKVFEGPWTEGFEQRARTAWKFINCLVDKLTAAGVGAVAAAYKAQAAMQQHISLANAPSPDADNTEWEAWLTSPQGPYDSGSIGVSCGKMVPDAQLRQLRFHWHKRSSAQRRQHHRA